MPRALGMAKTWEVGGEDEGRKNQGFMRVPACTTAPCGPAQCSKSAACLN
jgi:hypothetical protein